VGGTFIVAGAAIIYFLEVTNVLDAKTGIR